MAEIPTLFIAPHCTNLAEARRYERQAGQDTLVFAPGYFVLHGLYSCVAGQPEAELVLIDGPPDPRVDEGFQLLRMAPEVVRRLAKLTAADERELAAKCIRSLGSLAPDAAAIRDGVSQLVKLARRAELQRGFVFVTVLFR
ncbi:MAG: hypothetical protein JNM56_40850 [Planctomycetia bacterium]|nr:hypothetical protein [Planctomycetia bacterium]